MHRRHLRSHFVFDLDADLVPSLDLNDIEQPIRLQQQVDLAALSPGGRRLAIRRGRFQENATKPQTSQKRREIVDHEVLELQAENRRPARQRLQRIEEKRVRVNHRAIGLDITKEKARIVVADAIAADLCRSPRLRIDAPFASHESGDFQVFQMSRDPAVALDAQRLADLAERPGRI